MNVTMRGKVVVITGATSGIGQVAAETLAVMGARIVQIARDKQRGEAALRRLHDIAPHTNHIIHYADLLRFSEMKRVGCEIAKAEPRIDILVNNAGAMFGTRQLTEDGMERTFALNHMAYFVLTQLLCDRLVASAPARIINTSSDAHQVASFDLEDLHSGNAYADRSLTTLIHGGPAFKVYGRSKLCNILFTRELARRLSGTRVTANCLHPGFVATRFGDQSEGWFSSVIKVAKPFASTPQKGAETLVYLASSRDVVDVTGEYFYKCRVVTPASAARDAVKASRLWEESARLAGFPC